MKKQLFTTVAMVVCAAAAANAANEVIEITGATAFRSSASKAINDIYTAGGNFEAYYDNGVTDYQKATNQIWRGTFSTLGANVTIRTEWKGSVEGIRAVFQPSAANNRSYFKTSVLTGTPNNAPAALSKTGNLEQAEADLTFSDVKKSSTPIPGTSYEQSVGIVPFTMIANKTWRDDSRTSGITNVTSQQWRALLSAGKLPLSYFTGNQSHTDYVYATGRNDGSGTRTTYLAESGYGISKLVKQYFALDRTNSTTIPSIVLAPAGGGYYANGVSAAANASTVWGQDVDGNGGYDSGSALAGDLSKTTANTTVYTTVDLEDDGAIDWPTDYIAGATGKCFLISFLSGSDAATARGVASGGANNAAILGYDGVRLDDLAATGNSTLTNADKAKIATGAYTAWGNEQLINISGNSVATTVNDKIKEILATDLVEGVKINDMKVVRALDGGIIDVKQ